MVDQLPWIVGPTREHYGRMKGTLGLVCKLDVALCDVAMNRSGIETLEGALEDAKKLVQRIESILANERSNGAP